MSRAPALSLPPLSHSPHADVAAPAASADERAQLAQLAAEFESMLMLEMIKQMRQSMLGEGAEGEGLGADTFSGTIDSELSRHLAKAGGLGLQGAMLDAWDRQRGVSHSASRDVAAVHPRSGVPIAVAAAGPVAVAASASVNRPGLADVSVPAHAHEPGLSLEIDAKVSSGYGWRRDPFQGRSKFHSGIDLAARYGTEVPSAASGTVVTAAEQGAYGLTVVVRHDGGYETRYAHLSALDVRPGDVIEKGAVVGRVGSTGRSTAPHLHFEVTQQGQRVDPDRFVNNLTSDIKGQ